MIRTLAITIVLCLLTIPARADYTPESGKLEIKTLSTIWHDITRDRDVPVKIYYPANAAGKLPIIIFSHGLGGSREGYSYLGKYWAANGFVSVHLTHHGSDTEAVMKNGLADMMSTGRELVTHPENAINRVKDVSYAIDQLTAMNTDETSPLNGRLDLSEIGMSGHSFGGATTMMIAGQGKGRTKMSLTDDRVKCAFALCAPVPMRKQDRDVAYTQITMPVFIMTGTRDDSPIGDTKAADRRVPFDKMEKNPAYLTIFDGADHMFFAGRKTGGTIPSNDPMQQLVLKTSLAFWDAYLRGNQGAKHFLSDGSYAKMLGNAGVFEHKND